MPNKFQASQTSYEQTGALQVCNGPGVLTGVLVITDGTNVAKLILDDSIGGGGSVLLEMSIIGSNHYGGRNYTFPVAFRNGLYATITGTGASYIAEYIKD